MATRKTTTVAEPRKRGRLLAAVALVAALVVPGCDAARHDIDEDTIVLAAANTFASGRTAELLEDALSVADICGAVRVRYVPLASSHPRDIATALDGESRCTIAVIGDRSLLMNVDPEGLPADIDGLIVRRVDLAALLDRVRALRDDGVLIATAPLGIAGHVETPELVSVAEALREAQLVDVDLQAIFTPLQHRELFVRGADVLDELGEELLARELVSGIVDGSVDVPHRNAAEAAARLETAAFDAWLHEGNLAKAAALLALAEDTPAASTRQAARRAALHTALEGWNGGAAFASFDEHAPDPDAPGLALALALANRAPRDWIPSDPVEAGLVAASLSLSAGDDTAAAARVAALVAQHPHRLDAWLGMQLMSLARATPERLRGRAIRALEAHSHLAIDARDALRVSNPWPQSAPSILPALIAAQRPFAQHTPSGPWFDTARRRARLGFPEVATLHLDAAIEQHRDLHPIALALREALQH